jgi:NAD+ kinase
LTIRSRSHPLDLIGVVLHPTRNMGEVLQEIDQWAHANHLRVAGRQHDDARLPSDWERLNNQDFTGRVCLVFSLGGDGTMLGAMRLMGGVSFLL